METTTASRAFAYEHGYQQGVEDAQKKPSGIDNCFHKHAQTYWEAWEDGYHDTLLSRTPSAS